MKLIWKFRVNVAFVSPKTRWQPLMRDNSCLGMALVWVLLQMRGSLHLLSVHVQQRVWRRIIHILPVCNQRPSSVHNNNTYLISVLPNFQVAVLPQTPTKCTEPLLMSRRQMLQQIENSFDCRITLNNCVLNFVPYPSWEPNLYSKRAFKENVI